MSWTTNRVNWTKNTTGIGSTETSGSGGGDMAILQDDTTQASDFLSGIATWENNTSYSFEKVFFTNRDKKTVVTTDYLDSYSTGGGDINFHSDTFENRKSTLSSISSYINLSSYPLPKAFFTNRVNRTKTTHAAVLVNARDKTGGLVSGNLKAFVGDTQVVGIDLEGQGRVGLPIPPWITDGESGNESGLVYSYEYTPDAGGVSSRRSSVEGKTEINTTFTELVARIEDNTGDPLSNEGFIAGGFSSRTDASGEIRFLAPTGDTVTITTLQGSYSEERELAEDTSSQYDFVFTYPGVVVTATKPNGQPLQEVPVSLANQVVETDENGKAVSNTVPLGSYTITAYNYYEADIVVTELGSTFTLEFGGETSVFTDPTTGETVGEFDSLTLQVNDGTTLEAVSNTDITIPGADISQSTSQDGRATMAVPPVVTAGSPVGAEYTAYIAQDDERYSFTEAKGVVGEGESEEEVDLERETKTSQL